MLFSLLRPLACAAIISLGIPTVAVHAAAPPGGANQPPAVGVVVVKKTMITEQVKIIGRVQAIDRVEVVARVNAYLDERLFEEGADVKKGELLYRLERGPFETDVEARKAEIDQYEAQVENARLAYNRAAELAQRQVGPQSTADSTRAAYLGALAQVRAAKAQLEAAQINLDYTEIRSPVDGRIGLSSVTIGNVVGPGSGTLATIVSQDPMHVVFPMSVRGILELREQYSEKGWEAVRVRLRLSNGKIYAESGTLNFVDVTVAKDTDTIMLRADIANPISSAPANAQNRVRELTDNEFVTVLIESVEPKEMLAIPRVAVLTDQQGNYVYVVGEDNIAQVRRITLGQSSPEQATIADGLKEGEQVIIDGIQRVRPKSPVTPTPVELKPAE